MNLFPPWTQLGKKIESATRKALFDFKLLENAKGLSVALSGGKDSITLLVMLKTILGRGFPKLPLHASHVNGKFSCGASVQESFLKQQRRWELQLSLLAITKMIASKPS